MRRFAWLCGLFPFLLAVVGCGGNGSGFSQPPPSPSFTISLSPSSVTLMQGGAAQAVQVAIGAQNGFTGAVSVTASGLPFGVTVSPSSVSLTPGIGGTL